MARELVEHARFALSARATTRVVARDELLPVGVSLAPPCELPPIHFATTAARSAAFKSSTSSQARRYDIFISRAAAEID